MSSSSSGAWRTAPPGRPIDKACDRLSVLTATRRLGIAGAEQDPYPDDTDPEKVLDLVFEAMRALISRNAIYLDVATVPTGETRSAR